MDNKNLDRLLLTGLEQWQHLRLHELEEELDEHRSEFLAAQDGLSIARENPGDIQPDIIKIL